MPLRESHDHNRLHIDPRQGYVDPDQLKAREVQQKGDKSSNQGFSRNGLRQAEDYNVKLQKENVDPVRNNQNRLGNLVPQMRKEGLQINITKLLHEGQLEFMSAKKQNTEYER
jgi:hypothetical protein